MRNGSFEKKARRYYASIAIVSIAIVSMAIVSKAIDA